jgi:hypothetical protein
MSAAPEIDLDISQLALDVANRKVRQVSTRIENSITDGTLTRTIDGASTLTLTVHDPLRVLLQSGVFDFAIDVHLDRFFWRLVQVNKQDDSLMLTFEDREVAYLREHYSPKKATRGKVTRAEFALSLVREVREERIPFVCPELDVTQQVAIATTKHKRTRASRAANRQKGLSLTAQVTIKGQLASFAQKKVAEQVLDVADSASADTRSTLALLCACIQESGMQNLSAAQSDHPSATVYSAGVLQVLNTTGSNMGIDPRDVSACANAFLLRGFYTDPQLGGGGAIAIASRNPSASPGRIAQATQGSAYPTRYDQWLGEAQGLLAAYGGVGTDDGSVDATQTKQLPYQFRRGTADGVRENSWTCLQRLAQEVNWRCFVSAGAVYFVSESELIQAKPRLVLDEQSDGVLGIDFDIDSGKPIHEATLIARASRWAVAPGAVVELQNCGPANGRWLCAQIDRDLFEATATITLRRASTPLPEPAADTKSVSNTSASGTNASQVQRAWDAATAISAKQYPYVWGGGHAHAGTPDTGAGGSAIGYDCSGSTGAVLAAAGMGFKLGDGVPVSGTLAASWGQPGEGQGLTVWASVQHVFMVFHTANGDVHFGTGDWGKGWGGAGFNPNMHPTSGFTPRHWPNT